MSTDKEKAAPRCWNNLYAIEAQLTEARRMLAETGRSRAGAKGKLESQAREISSIDGG